MSKTINKILMATAIFSMVAFLFMLSFNPVFADETAEGESTFTSAVDWIKSLSVEQVKGWIGAAIAFLASGVGAVILLVLKIAYDSAKKAKVQAEIKESKTAADAKIIELCNKFLTTEEETQEKVIEAMRDFARQYDIKLSDEVSNSVKEQKKVLDAYADKIKELEDNE